MRKCVHAAAAVILVVVTSLPARATLKAWLDSAQVAPGETVQLTLHRDGQSGGKPDLSSVRQTFDILATRSSTSIQIVNGTTSAGTDFVATLSPKRDGKLTVPSISWDGDRSQPLTLLVTGQSPGNAPGAKQSANAKVFLETAVDERQPYVQAAVQVTVRLYAAEPLYHASLDLPAKNDTVVQQVGSDEKSRVQRNGRDYDVVTRHYVVFPQRSGALQLAPPELQAEVAERGDRSSPFGSDPFAGFFGNSPFNSMLTPTKPIRLRGESIDLNVRPRPPNDAAAWLPARQVTLTTQWRPDPLQVRAGDPVTLDLHVHAVGLTGAQLPDLANLIELPPGLREYPDEAKLETVPQGSNVVGSRDQSVALIADQPGRFTIPPWKLRWWDTQVGQSREISVPGRTVEVLPTANSVATQPSGTPIPSRSVSTTGRRLSARPARVPVKMAAPARRADAALIWRLAAAAGFLLWLVTLGAWLFWIHRNRTRARRAQTNVGTVRPRAGKARAAFREACRNNDAQAARRCLLVWIEAARPDIRPAGLNALARATDQPSLSLLLRELDRACYVGGGQWSGNALCDALKELPSPVNPGDKDSVQLAPLYD
jgi:BatD DUF11 like domain